MLNNYLLDIIFVFFSVNFFNIFIFIPLFLLVLNIFFYYKKISFVKLNIYFFYYSIPLSLIYFLLYSVVKIDVHNNNLSLFVFLSSLIIYYIPLIYLINKNILKLSEKLSVVKCFFIFNSLLLSLYYIGYTIFN
jgi:hypothetical protein